MSEAHGPASVEAALTRARSAGAKLAARPFAERLEITGAALEVLRDPDSDAHARWLGELPGATGFHPANVARGLGLALEPLDAEAWRALARSELGSEPDVTPFPSVSVVLAGALPTPSVLQILPPLLLGSGLVVKPAVHDPVTPAVIREVLAGIDPALALALELVRFERGDAASSTALCRADCVVVTGSDEAVASYAARVPDDRRFVAAGHRFSVGVLGEGASSGAALDEAAAGIALDTALWDQLGCLSPVALFVLGARSVPDAVLESLTRAFEELDRTLPRGRVSLEARARTSQARDEAELRATSDPAIRLVRGEGFTLVAEAEPRLRASPLHRFLRIHALPEPGALIDALRPAAAHLAGVATAGLPDPTLAKALARLGASRIAPAGRLQAPPLGWRRENRPVLQSLLP